MTFHFFEIFYFQFYIYFHYYQEKILQSNINIIIYKKFIFNKKFMSNRLLWILIILVFFWTGYLYYNYKYLPAKEQKIQAQLIEKQLIEQEQKAKTIKKETVFKKEILIKKELTSEQKIQEIKANKQNYKTFTFDDWLKSYFLLNDNNLYLYFSGSQIWKFDLVTPDLLRVEKVYWKGDDLYIEVWNDKFYYNSITKNIVKIDLNIAVLYVKKADDKSLIIVTEKWSFNYSIFDKSLVYFSYFNDYVVFGDWYIWYVKTNQKRILTNLWYDNETGSDLIVYYNPSTKEKNIINRTKLNIIKMYMIADKLFVKTSDLSIYELQNLK